MYANTLFYATLDGFCAYNYEDNTEHSFPIFEDLKNTYLRE